MKVRIQLETKEDHMRIDFSRPLPYLFQESYFNFIEFGFLQFGKKTPKSLAQKVAFRSLGNSPVELCNPVKTYTDFFCSLREIPGLVQIYQHQPYQLVFCYGSLFDPTDIATQIVSIIIDHLYPYETVEWFDPISQNSDQVHMDRSITMEEDHF